jgi:protein ImuB
MGAERILRKTQHSLGKPVVIVAKKSQSEIISSISAAAQYKGLFVGQSLRDASAICPHLFVQTQNSYAEAQFLKGICRWSSKFSPWVAPEGNNGLIMDITGCSHLFGGEDKMVTHILLAYDELGLTTKIGCADTVGAAWALSRYSEKTLQNYRNGNAIEQEARATRSRSAKRSFKDIPNNFKITKSSKYFIAPPGKIRQSISNFPVAALRLEIQTQNTLAQLGLRQIGDIINQPRASLNRRFGLSLLKRVDQALGNLPEPISPLQPELNFGVRISFPDPIGLKSDIIAGIDRILDRLCSNLKKKNLGAQKVLLQAFKTDNTIGSIEVGLAQPSNSFKHIRDLMIIKIDDLNVQFGIDILRLEATRTEVLTKYKHIGHILVGERNASRTEKNINPENLISKLGVRIGLENIIRLHPAKSNIPEKTYTMLSAAWSEQAKEWPKPKSYRPIQLWVPEIINAPDKPNPLSEFKWRGKIWYITESYGPERISPEWWLDDPKWRSGVRDYWFIQCNTGDRLWIYYAHGGLMSSGWFCQGTFA